MLPEGWNREELGTVASFASGNTPSKQNTAYWGGDMPWISAKDLKRPVMSNSIDTLSDDGAAVAKLASPGSVLILVRGMTILKDIPVALAGRRLAFNQDVKCLSGRRGVENRYLALALTAKKRAIMRLVNTANHGTGRLDTDLLKSLLIEFPNSAEQQKIVELVSTWDQAIETVDKLIETARAQKTALMQQLLTGKRRLPGFEGAWRTFSFSDAFTVSNDKSKQVPKGEYEQAGDWPIVDQGQGRVAGFTSNRRPRTDLPLIVFGDHTRAVKWIDTPFCPGADGTQILKPKPCFDPKFAYYLLQSISLPNLGYSRHMRELKEREFRAPECANEQAAVSDLLDGAVEEVVALAKQRECFEIEKRALMQQLLTGKRRVKVEEPA